ncbi:unnamed protein product [Polarella glacialis]|uniref:Uncharacterized protein n=1 Tax=Polarella glacialis TaxID=89957 RepID=A0A813FDS0_POLGL|nr:unnamed protein product [Polarella glacialis]
MDLLLESPPPPPQRLQQEGATPDDILAAPAVPLEVDAAEEETRLKDWASTSPPLLSVVGPLLAKASSGARDAARSELERIGSLAGPAPPSFGAASDAAADNAERGGASSDEEGKTKGPAPSDAPAYDFYNEDIPMDVFLNCEDHTVRTATGVPCFDLLDSDEEEAAGEQPIAVAVQDEPAEEITEL